MNFVWNVILRKWIFWKMLFWICEFLLKMIFWTLNFRTKSTKYRFLPHCGQARFRQNWISLGKNSYFLHYYSSSTCPLSFMVQLIKKPRRCYRKMHGFSYESLATLAFFPSSFRYERWSNFHPFHSDLV